MTVCSLYHYREMNPLSLLLRTFQVLLWLKVPLYIMAEKTLLIFSKLSPPVALYNTPCVSYMGQLAGKQFCRKASRSAARHQADYGPATPDGKKSNNILRCIRRSAASRCRKVLPSLTILRDTEILESSNEPLRRQRDWSISPARTGWESWRSGGSGKIPSVYRNSWREGAKKSELGSSQ